MTEGLTKSELPTPALVLDLDRFESNLRTMADYCRRAGCGFRPHAKTHKCVWIARRQLASGALGVSVATVAEAEAMVREGIRGVLLTSPVLDPRKLQRLVALAGEDAGLMLAVGCRQQAELLAEEAARAGRTVDVLVDVDVGDQRTGTLPGQPALELAQFMDRSPGLRVRGLQAYSGEASHVVGFQRRAKVSRQAMSQAVQTRNLLLKAGIDAGILSGGSTGTYNIDSGIDGVTELQVGSYIFMDVDYRRIGSRSGSAVYDDFQPSLTVLTTVVSAAHRDCVTVDAGVKALSPDAGCPPEVKDAPGLTYEWCGDEFGLIRAADAARLPALGQRLELIVPHCDPTVNLYDLIYLARGEQIEDAVPTCARRGDAG